MKMILAIGAGSFAGGVCRYLLTLLVQAKTTAQFPLGTLTVNLAGCFLIGIVFGFFDRGLVSREWNLFLATGVLGGFTTFSAFSLETFTLLKGGRADYAVLYVLASVLLGLLATAFAYWMVKQC